MIENNEEIENYAAQDFEIMITMEATKRVNLLLSFGTFSDQM